MHTSIFVCHCRDFYNEYINSSPTPTFVVWRHIGILKSVLGFSSLLFLQPMLLGQKASSNPRFQVIRARIEKKWSNRYTCTCGNCLWAFSSVWRDFLSLLILSTGQEVRENLANETQMEKITGVLTIPHPI